jgi:colanic acid biosynthesis glycosyl transferase WcaI
LIDAGIPAHKVAIVPNWTDCVRVEPRKLNNRFRERHKLDGKFVVMYSGNIGLCQGLERLLDTAQLLQHREDIVFLLVGGGAMRTQLEQSAHDRQLSNVRFLDYQPATQLADSLSAADVHLVPLDPRVSRYLMPSKLYGILASGTPVIAIAPGDCELAEIVEKEEVGFVIEPNNPAALAELIEGLVKRPGHLVSLGHRARQVALARFDRPICVAQFSQLIDTLAGSEARGENRAAVSEGPRTESGNQCIPSPPTHSPIQNHDSTRTGTMALGEKAG